MEPLDICIGILPSILLFCCLTLDCGHATHVPELSNHDLGFKVKVITDGTMESITESSNIWRGFKSFRNKLVSDIGWLTNTTTVTILTLLQAFLLFIAKYHKCILQMYFVLFLSTFTECWSIKNSKSFRLYTALWQRKELIPTLL